MPARPWNAGQDRPAAVRGDQGLQALEVEIRERERHRARDVDRGSAACRCSGETMAIVDLDREAVKNGLADGSVPGSCHRDAPEADECDKSSSLRVARATIHASGRVLCG
jgi:hypothetical protein